MAEKIAISVPGYVLDMIEKNRPKGTGRSEYIAGLVVKQIMEEQMLSPTNSEYRLRTSHEPMFMLIEYLDKKEAMHISRNKGCGLDRSCDI